MQTRRKKFRKTEARGRPRPRPRDSKARARSPDWRLVCSRKFLSGNTFWMAFEFRIFMKMTGFARRAEPRIIKESPPQTENINVSHATQPRSLPSVAEGDFKPSARGEFPPLKRVSMDFHVFLFRLVRNGKFPHQLQHLNHPVTPGMSEEQSSPFLALR